MCDQRRGLDSPPALPESSPVAHGPSPRLLLLAEAERALSLFQVLHQLKRLGKIWQDVLPVNVYCRAMGTLLNTALVEIMSRIVALEVRTEPHLGGVGGILSVSGDPALLLGVAHQI